MASVKTNIYNTTLHESQLFNRDMLVWNESMNQWSVTQLYTDLSTLHHFTRIDLQPFLFINTKLFEICISTHFNI